MSETTNTNAAAAAAPPKKGGKLFLIVGIVVVLLAGGVGAFFYLSRASAKTDDAKTEKTKKNKKSADEDETATEEKAGKAATKEEVKQSLKVSLPEDEDVKHVIELQPFIVNLADSENARYLRTTVSIGIGESAEAEKPSAIFTTRIRNAILAVLSVKKSEDVLTVEGKAKLRKEILEAAQSASEEPHVEAIYITDFIVQL